MRCYHCLAGRGRGLGRRDLPLVCSYTTIVRHQAQRSESHRVVNLKEELYSEHKKDRMVDVRSKRCRHAGCTEGSSYGVYGVYGADGSTKREFCSAHMNDGMVYVISKRCNPQGYTRQPSFGVDGSIARGSSALSTRTEWLM